jgi:hypothetical protein
VSLKNSKGNVQLVAENLPAAITMRQEPPAIAAEDRPPSSTGSVLERTQTHQLRILLSPAEPSTPELDQECEAGADADADTDTDSDVDTEADTDGHEEVYEEQVVSAVHIDTEPVVLPEGILGSDGARSEQLAGERPASDEPDYAGGDLWLTLNQIKAQHYAVVNEDGESKYAQLLSGIKRPMWRTAQQGPHMGETFERFPFGSVRVEWLQLPHRKLVLELGADQQTEAGDMGAQTQTALTSSETARFQDWVAQSLSEAEQQRLEGKQHKQDGDAAGIVSDLVRTPSVAQQTAGQFEFWVAFDRAKLFDARASSRQLCNFVFRRGDDPTIVAKTFIQSHVAPTGTELREYVSLVEQIVDFIRLHFGGEVGVENVLSVWENVEDCIVNAALSDFPDDFAAYKQAYKLLGQKDFQGAVRTLEDALTQGGRSRQTIKHALEEPRSTIPLIPIMNIVRYLATGEMDLIARRAFDRLSKACQAVARDVSAFDRVSAACDDGERLIDQMSTWSLTPAEEKRFGDWRQRFNVFRLAITAFKHGLEGKYPEGIQLFTGAIDAITEDPTKPTLHQLEGLTLRNLKRKARSMNVVEDQIDDLDDCADPKAAAISLILEIITSAAEQRSLAAIEEAMCAFLTKCLDIVMNWAVQAGCEQMKAATGTLVKWLQGKGDHPLAQYQQLEAQVSGSLLCRRHAGSLVRCANPASSGSFLRRHVH